MNYWPPRQDLRTQPESLVYQPPPLEIGSKWTWTNPNDPDDVRFYELEIVQRALGMYCSMYGMRRMIDGYPVDGERGLGWATHGTLQGITPTKGWAPCA